MNRTTAIVLTSTAGVSLAALIAGCGSAGSTGSAGTTGSPGTPLASVTTPATTSGSTSSAPPTTTRSTRSTAPSASQTTDGGKLPRCMTEHLRITLTYGNSDMQGSHSSLQFTNTGTRPCELTGAPGVSYVAGNAGHQVGLPATRIIGHQRVVIQPGGTASAGLFRSSAPEKTPSCRKVPVRGLRVYPPDSYTAALVAAPGTACAAPLNGPFLKVGPVLPGSHNTM